MPKKPKKDKKPPNLKPAFHLSKEQKLEAAKATRPKKKHAPDRPQPAWMFPPDEENPVLNPVIKPEEQIRKEQEKHNASIDFLQHKVFNAPMKKPPPGLLITLVGAFLSSYGFDGASRLYTAQILARNRLDEWKIEIGQELPKEFPPLIQVFKEWHAGYQIDNEVDETSSSDSDDSHATRHRKGKSKAAKATRVTLEVEQHAKDEASSSEGSDSDSSDDDSSDVDTGGRSPKGKAQKPEKASKPQSGSSSVSNSGSSSDSDSDMDDATEPAGISLPDIGSSIKAGTSDNAVTSKAGSSDNESSDSSSDSESNSDSESQVTAETDSYKSPMASIEKASQAKVQKSDTSSSNGTSSDSDSDSESDSGRLVNLPRHTAGSKIESNLATEKQPRVGSDSSETLQASSARKKSTDNTSLSSSSPSSSSASSPDPNPDESTDGLPAAQTYSSTIAPSKRKRSASPSTTKKAAKKINAPFQRIASDTKVDSRFASNAYQPYEYADRAHQDLSITRGRDFTKEKNKKKRGSYRGGPIDVNGGKGVKIDD
ncbi:uncharacterized protein KY384_004265 [Bacidia gigantensis]|uniref:uncharacterized protein n=1 Tax=Bacidia gigantensis TaxID=2732470 RepID=UPI001D043F5B|nr:uncharacterized protein KY384_004265 [Bacidia gigantensis]KAG8530908.1 hypothetical protein KY384_004265 [Bacidia gigantensis]